MVGFTKFGTLIKIASKYGFCFLVAENYYLFVVFFVLICLGKEITPRPLSLASGCLETAEGVRGGGVDRQRGCGGSDKGGNEKKMRSQRKAERG